MFVTAVKLYKQPINIPASIPQFSLVFRSMLSSHSTIYLYLHIWCAIFLKNLECAFSLKYIIPTKNLLLCYLCKVPRSTGKLAGKSKVRTEKYCESIVKVSRHFWESPGMY